MGKEKFYIGDRLHFNLEFNLDFVNSEYEIDFSALEDFLRKSVIEFFGEGKVNVLL